MSNFERRSDQRKQKITNKATIKALHSRQSRLSTRSSTSIGLDRQRHLRATEQTTGHFVTLHCQVVLSLISNINTTCSQFSFLTQIPDNGPTSTASHQTRPINTQARTGVPGPRNSLPQGGQANGQEDFTLTLSLKGPIQDRMARPRTSHSRVSPSGKRESLCACPDHLHKSH